MESIEEMAKKNPPYKVAKALDRMFEQSLNSPMPSPKTPQEIMDSRIDEISAVFEGFVLGRLGVAERIHPEIKDEFEMIIRSSMQSLLLHVMEKDMSKEEIDALIKSI